MTARPLLLACFLVAGCGGGGRNESAAAGANEDRIVPAPAPTVEPIDVPIECALDGAAAFARICTVEKVPGPGGLGLTVRNPSGGFRRLLVTRDGRGIAAADGAEPAKVSVIGPGWIEVAIGRDRYRLPASVRP